MNVTTISSHSISRPSKLGPNSLDPSYDLSNREGLPCGVAKLTPQNEGRGRGMEEKEGSKDFEEIRVGEKVKVLREQKGLSLKEVADLTGFSTALLSQMENHLVSPSLGTIIKLANALNVRVGDFLG